MSKFVTTPKGTKLPLLNLKGKDYLMAAYRLQWLTEQEPFYTIETEFPKLTDDETVARSTIKIFDEVIISRNPAILIEIKGSESPQLFDNRPVFVGINIT